MSRVYWGISYMCKHPHQLKKKEKRKKKKKNRKAKFSNWTGLTLHWFAEHFPDCGRIIKKQTSYMQRVGQALPTVQEGQRLLELVPGLLYYFKHHPKNYQDTSAHMESKGMSEFVEDCSKDLIRNISQEDIWLGGQKRKTFGIAILLCFDWLSSFLCFSNVNFYSCTYLLVYTCYLITVLIFWSNVIAFTLRVLASCTVHWNLFIKHSTSMCFYYITLIWPAQVHNP